MTQHPYKVDDILVWSWGYEQTNIDFFKVTELRGKTMVMLQQVHKRLDRGDDLASYVVPVPEEVKGEPLRRRVVQDYDGAWVARMKHGSSLRLWKGTPEFETGPGAQR